MDFLLIALDFKILDKGSEVCRQDPVLSIVGQTPWKPFWSKLKNHLKTFKMLQKVITILSFVNELSINDNKNGKIVHAKVICVVI